MERRERRHKASSKATSSVVETKAESGKKPAKLVLKRPSALSPPVAKKPRLSGLLDDTLSSETPEEALEHLLAITASDLTQLSLVGERGLGVLCEVWRRWRGRGDVCTVVVRVFVELLAAVTAGGGGEGAGEEWGDRVRDFALQLAEHELDDVKVLGLAALRRLALHDEILVPSALKLAQKEIHSVHHAVRVECLNLIGQLSHVTSEPEISLVTLEEYCSDPDPRVRAVSLQGLLWKLESDIVLSKSVYMKACDALTDDDEAVRTVAVRLICSLVRRTPEALVAVPQQPPLPSRDVRMCDDAFARVCDLLNDVSMPVRALAAGKLGDFCSVSGQLLEQTLDKKLMSHLKGVKSDHERQKEQHAAGGTGGGSSGFNTGRTWGSSIPKVDSDPGERSLMSAGACGAFVHGLEDEYLEVRSAAVDSMCQLGTHSLSFAAQCVDFLVDMFNDEIQSVRLSAINSLRHVSATIQLREDQMETVLGVLEESSTEIREAMHSLLSTCKITTVLALRTTIRDLLANLKKYSSDKDSIWRCLRELGCHHSHLVSCLVPELLNSHPFLMGKEPDVDDPAYVCILIVVFNSAALCPTIPPLLPSHVFRHYTYLRDALPHLIPHISVGMPSNSACKLVLPKKHTDHAVAHSFLHQVLCRAQATLPPSPSSPSSSSSSSVPSCSPAHRRQVLGTCVSDLLRVGSLDVQLSDRANCAATFLQSQMLSEEVSEALSQDLVLLPSDGRLGPAHIHRSINEIMIHSYRLQTLCHGLGAELVGGVRLARVVAHAMQLMLAVQCDMDTEQSKEFMDMKLKFYERLKILESYFSENELSLPIIVKPLLDLDFVTVATDSLMESLHSLITTPLFNSLAPHDVVPVRMARATIHEPQNFSQDDHTRFVYSLALSIPVQATLTNISRPTDVAIQLKFPDGRRLLFAPKPSDFRSTGVDEFRLDTSVVTSHGLWTDPCQVELCVCVRLDSDVPETSPTRQNPATTVPCSHSNRVCSHSEDSLEPGHCVLGISEVVKINIFPQETASRSFNVFGGP